MRVLGIDPGFSRCGVAVVENPQGKDTLVYSACIETSTGDSFSERMRHVAVEIKRLILLYDPDAVAVEEIYFTKNQKTAIQVAEMRGVLLYLVVEAGVTLAEYNPLRIKLAMTGQGNATKQQVTFMVEKILGKQNGVVHDDEYDAIAVALTHLASYRAIR